MFLSRRNALLGGIALPLSASALPGRPAAAPSGGVRRLSPALDSIIASDARLEVLAEGFAWSEGPVWIADGGFLLFSDVPQNRIHRWSATDGASVFLTPSGYAGSDPSGFREPGSNGLIPGPPGSILMADHGNRAIARLDLKTRAKTILAQRFEGRRFNSPNDLVKASSGALFFTDPPYGLEGLDQSPLKEIPFSGVYRLDPDSAVSLLTDALSFPNGIALSPDERTLYVAVSDPGHAVLMAYDLTDEGPLARGRVLRDFTPLVGPEAPGLPDGMAVDSAGRLFCTGPGGVHILTPAGESLGVIDTGGAAANCAFGEDGRSLFITAGSRLLRVRTLTQG
ncbi:MAG: gluconolactonase [Brevundimonas sp.]|uniref:SMP-30/gluconolactonase/LRE family protein n=1 Tax=Brevundimonas TaxID=41275 RepID=UPI000DBBEFE9|nr:MAG: gluconolactonase [Brevundimonas sp.]